MEEEKKKHKEIELRSEEAQEIMNYIPSWILRWGITVLFGILVTLLAGSYFFKHPDIVEASITISMQNPPAYVLAKSTGRITHLYQNNEANVSKGDMLAVIENSAHTEDVILLKKRIGDWEVTGYDLKAGKRLFNDRSLHLGEVESAYASFVSVLAEYTNFVKQNYYRQKIKSGVNQLKSLKDYYRIAQAQYKLNEKEQLIANRIYGRDSTLHTRKAMIDAEYDESQRNYLQSLQSRESTKMSLNQISVQIEQNESSLLDIHRQALTEKEKYIVDLRNAIEQLCVQITTWEQKYLISSPITGKLTFMSIWSDHQNVQANELVFVVAPLKGSLPIGKAMLPVQNSGKVKLEQLVNIRLENYPDQEFGYLKGVICCISPVPTAEGMYVVEVKLPDGLRTNYGKILPMSKEMKGNAEIVTEDLRLIERVIAPIKKMIKQEFN